ncbi:hypothetical protein BD289DRAFT_485103 [Coniella lustricola]|uniref:Clr5 domain-containing protein n=1 Tax=Coniella lustricola TaxID=2025994 RepID=A0A2T2ZZR6_9PEZI|nr:hypothetical protein BD289DRAFT_485103 [Coniella lustricola]
MLDASQPQNPGFDAYLSPTLPYSQPIAFLSPTEAAAAAASAAIANPVISSYDPFQLPFKTEPMSPPFTHFMPYSTPSPSENGIQAPATWSGVDPGLYQAAAEPARPEAGRVKTERLYNEDSMFSGIATPTSESSHIESVDNEKGDEGDEGDEDNESAPEAKRRSINDDDSAEKEALFIKYRTLITELYDTMKLEDLQATMRDQYGLNATKRMFKARLKSWGVEKNVTGNMVQRLVAMLSEQICCILGPEKVRRQQLRTANTTLTLNVGRLDIVKIQKYIKRNSDGVKTIRKMLPVTDKSLDLIRCLTPEGGSGTRGHNRGDMKRARLSMSTARLLQILPSLKAPTDYAMAQPSAEMAQLFGVASPGPQSGPAQVLQWPGPTANQQFQQFQQQQTAHLSMPLLNTSPSSPVAPLAWGHLAATTATAAPTATAMSSPLEPMSSMQLPLQSLWLASHALQHQGQTMLGLGQGQSHDGSTVPMWQAPAPGNGLGAYNGGF